MVVYISVKYFCEDSLRYNTVPEIEISQLMISGICLSSLLSITVQSSTDFTRFAAYVTKFEKIVTRKRMESRHGKNSTSLIKIKELK